MSKEQGHAIRTAQQSTEVRDWQHALVDLLLRTMVFVAPVVLVGGGYYALQRGTPGVIPIYLVAYSMLLLARFAKGVSYHLKTGVMLALFYGLAVLFFVQAGLSGDGRVFLLAFCFAAVVSQGRRWGFAALGLSGLTMAVFAILYATGVLELPIERLVTTPKLAAWISNTLTLVLAIVFVITSTDYLLRRFVDALAEGQVLTQALEQGRAQAEADSRRTHEQAERVRWAAAFGSTIISMRRRDELTLRLVREMERTFDLYAVHLFLKAARGDVVVLDAAAGEQADRLMAKGWQIPVGSRLLPGRVAQVGTEQAAFVDPGEIAELPRTRVEIALPLVTRGELLGVLDIHATRTSFSEEDLQLFRVVADYATTALDVLRLLEESEARMQEMRALYVQYTMTSWRSVLEAEQTEAYSAGTVELEAVRALAATALAAAAPRSAQVAGNYLLVVPLIARDLPLGYLAFSRAVRWGDWDEEIRALIETAAERFALALDNTRLLIEARQRAFYEEQLGQIGDVVWSNPSVELIMERSVQELGRFLGASEVALYLHPAEDAAAGAR